MFRELFRAGERMSDIRNIQFVHESTVSCGYQNRWWPFWIFWRWMPKFRTTWTSMTSPKNCFSWNCFINSDCGFALGCENSRHNGMGSPLPSSSSRFVSHTRCTVPEWCEFENICELNSLGSLECFPQSYQMLVLERTPKSSVLVNSRSWVFLWWILCPLSCATNQVVHTNPILVSKHWADSQNEWFGVSWIAVPSVKLRNSTFLEERTVICYTISLRLQNRRTSIVPVKNSSRTSWPFLNSKYKSHRFLFLSNQYRWTLTWRWSCLWIYQVQCSAFANHFGFEESAGTLILGRYSTRLQLLLHRFPVILHKKRILKKIFHLTLLPTL